MQPASMLGAALGQGIGTDISHFQSLPGAVGVGQLRESAQHQFSQPSRQLVPPQLKMDDFLDQILLPSWSEMGGTIRAPWDYDSGSLANALNMDTEDCLSAPPNMSMLPSMTSGRVGRPSEIQGLSFQAREVQRKFSHRQAACFESGAASSAGHRQIDNMAPTLAQGPQGVQNPIPRISEGMASTRPTALHLNSGNFLLANSSLSQLAATVTGSSRGLGIIRSPTVISSGSEGSGNQLSPSDGHSVSTDALTRRPPFGVVSPPLHDDETRPGAQDHLFNNFAGQIGQLQIPGAPSQQSHQKQVSQGVSGTSYASHTGLSQSQAAAGVAAGARTRVRARRGQATDPHSIAERLRRERIAERMKALQELVPNANKTDKASMLDEIIEYVKFLQLQVKVLSMSRLGGAGAVSRLVADSSAEGHDKTTLGLSAAASGPSQDGMAVTEHQVARLMEENMGSAMQFLQSKGLCLMPMSLATSISTTNSRSPTGIQSGMQEIGSANFLRPDVLSSTSAGCNINSVITGAMMPSATITCNGSGHGVATEEDRGLSYSDDRNQASAVENMNVAETDIHIFATETSIKNKHEDTS